MDLRMRLEMTGIPLSEPPPNTLNSESISSVSDSVPCTDGVSLSVKPEIFEGKRGRRGIGIAALAEALRTEVARRHDRVAIAHVQGCRLVIHRTDFRGQEQFARGFRHRGDDGGAQDVDPEEARTGNASRQIGEGEEVLERDRGERVGQIDAIGNGIVEADLQELEFDFDLGAGAHQLFEHHARGEDLGDAVAKNHAVVLGVEGHLLNGEGLLHGGDDRIEILRIGGIGQVERDGGGRFAIDPLLRGILHDHERCGC